MTMLTGILVKGYGGFYYVNVNGQEIECTLRGKFRKKKQSFLPGDFVTISLHDNGTGTIEEVSPRKNHLIRPPVANVDQVVIVMALREPAPQLELLDRLLVIAESLEINPIICFNKADKVEDYIEITDIYKKIGYQVIVTSAIHNLNVDQLKNSLKGKITVFAGLSGVGKSSLLNMIKPELSLKVGQVSEKIKRGRHTTRHVELISLPDGGMVADTPGFSNLELSNIAPNHLSFFFPEMEKVQNECRFSQCLHHKEPDCAVKLGVDHGTIEADRYKNYLTFLDELRNRERRY